MSVFLRYLLCLENESLAITICQHFRRIAIEDTTEPWTINFLTGQSADIHEADKNNPRKQFRQTTALHEAVHASNYILVEYFVLTDFVVDALDESGERALDLAHRLENEQSARKPRANKQIIALLQQNRRTNIETSALGSNLPLGWEECSDGLQAWRETSIESEHDAITFRSPKAGLWQDQRIAFGERRVTDSKGQVYHLDPIRFLRGLSPQQRKPKVATQPHFGDQLYVADMKKTSIPPDDPFLDDRAWYRSMARTWLALTRLEGIVNAVWIFVAFSILGRVLAWTREAQIALHMIATVSITAGLVQTKLFHIRNSLAILNLSAHSTEFIDMSLCCIPDLIVSLLIYMWTWIWMLTAGQIGICFVARQELDPARYTLLGSILFNDLLVSYYHLFWIP